MASQASSMRFGHGMRSQFQFDPSYRPLNHGSYGTYPLQVRERLHQCQALSESRPDAFFRQIMPRELDASRAAIASFLGVDQEECVFIPNATTGVNTVLRSLVFNKGDVIVHFSTIYGGCYKTVEYLKETTPLDNSVVDTVYPIGDDEVLTRFQKRISDLKRDGKCPKVALFDTVCSMPGVKVPWERLVQICREEGVLSLVDGAHGVGHLDLNLADTRPDFFVSNCHKWFYVPRGCGLFYVQKKHQHLIRTSIPTSHGYQPRYREGQPKVFNPLAPSGKSAFVDLFEFVGTTDVSPYLCIKAAIQFRQDVCGGEDMIREYCVDIANKGTKVIAESLGTEVMDNAEGTLTKCNLTNVKLPLKMGENDGEIKPEDGFRVMAWVAMTLIKEHDAYVGTYFHGGHFWVRLSGQIYLEIGDFEWMAEVLKTLCKRAEKGEYLSWRPSL